MKTWDGMSKPKRERPQKLRHGKLRRQKLRRRKLSQQTKIHKYSSCESFAFVFFILSFSLTGTSMIVSSIDKLSQKSGIK